MPKISFNEVMALEDTVGDFAAGFFESDFAAGADVDEAVSFEAADGHRDGGRGHFKPAGECGGNDSLAFSLGFGDGFEVVLFRDGDSHALPNCSMAPAAPDDRGSEKRRRF
jgi:hypothetical protein